MKLHSTLSENERGILGGGRSQLSMLLDRLMNALGKAMEVITRTYSQGAHVVENIHDQQLNNYNQMQDILLDIQAREPLDKKDMQNICSILDILSTYNEVNPFTLKSIKDIYFGVETVNGIRGCPVGKTILIALRTVFNDTLQVHASDIHSLSSEQLQPIVGTYIAGEELSQRVKEFINVVNILEQNDHSPNRVYTSSVYENSNHNPDALLLDIEPNIFDSLRKFMLYHISTITS